MAEDAGFELRTPDPNEFAVDRVPDSQALGGQDPDPNFYRMPNPYLCVLYSNNSTSTDPKSAIKVIRSKVFSVRC